MTHEELMLLEKLASGELDGPVGDEWTSHGYRDVTFWKCIRDGVPMVCRQGEDSSYFDGDENVHVAGKYTEDAYETDEQKLLFLQKYGWLMDDEDVRAYSAKFK
jgi:hypothetical protein